MKIFKQMVSNERERVSSKRVIAICCVILLCVAFILQCFQVIEKQEDSALIDALVYIAVVCLFGSSLDKFSFRKNTGQ